MATKKHPRKTFSLEVYARIWAKLVAIARAENFSISAEHMAKAYSAYVEGRTAELETLVTDLAMQLGVKRSEILKRWKKLPEIARRETNRRAFQS